jgi:hypothetical protein
MEAYMFEVIAFHATKATSEYQGDNWVQALGAYGKMSDQGIHTVLWEEETPVREYHPSHGHVGSGTHNATKVA